MCTTSRRDSAHSLAGASMSARQLVQARLATREVEGRARSMAMHPSNSGRRRARTGAGEVGRCARSLWQSMQLLAGTDGHLMLTGSDALVHPLQAESHVHLVCGHLGRRRWLLTGVGEDRDEARTR